MSVTAINKHADDNTVFKHSINIQERKHNTQLTQRKRQVSWLFYEDIIVDYIIIHYGKDKDGNVWKKVVGRYKDKAQARAAGEEEARKLVYKNEYVTMVSGNISDNGDPIGRFMFYNRWG